KERPGVLEAQELVNTAVQRCLEGRRDWEPANGASEDALLEYLGRVMGSIAINCKTSAAVTRRVAGDEVLYAQPERLPTSQRISVHSTLEWIATTFEDDPEAWTVLEQYAEGNTEPREIAEATQWSVAKVRAVRVRMSRRLRAGDMDETADGEGDREGASPSRRDDDGSQASDERRGAPRERDRGALGSAGRRGTERGGGSGGGGG